jgi:hypothetical protein
VSADSRAQMQATVEALIRRAAGRSPAEIMRLLYRDVSGFATEGIGPDGRRMRDSRALTYGELTAVGIRQLVAAAGIGPGDRFVDLGSGTGRVPLHVAMVTKGVSCLGIEIDRERHDDARSVLKLAEAAGLVAPRRCRFRNADLRTTTLRGGTIYFANSTCFPERLLNFLGRRLAVTAGLERFATFQELPAGIAALFDASEVASCHTSWSPKVELHVYHRRAERGRRAPGAQHARQS